ncbi:MAG: general secretion pathway protein GspB [Oceanicoccus sp.]
MSYILDALKKSDQERQQGNNPTLQTIHKPNFSDDASSKWRFVALFMVMLVVSLAVLAGWYLLVYSDTKQQSVESAGEQASVNRGVQSDTSRTPDVVAALPVNQAQKYVSVEERDKKISVTEPAVPAAVVEFWELPDPIQQQIPSLTFSFHVYSTNAERRTIIINKRRVKEGAVVAEGLTLIEITKEGVVLDWKNRHRFMINVVENW